ncbi:MAG: Glu/Leu/Phe/Val dehydrogenase dimerization domain-containing protein [Myxococcota bacterium]
MRTVDGLVGSHPALEELRAFVETDERDAHDHEGVYIAVGQRTGALVAAFVHWTDRGQGAGGVRHWRYDTFESLVRDGLRLSRGMTRKNALAGLWWGGGKGIVAATNQSLDPDWRRDAYRDFGDFMSWLRGVYVTAEDVGTTEADMRAVFERTRHTTCIPTEFGGSGNPSEATAKGVVCAMEGALHELGRGELAAKRIVMQGAGNVAAFMMGELLNRGVASILATDVSQARLDTVRQRFADGRLTLRQVGRDDVSVLAEACDVLAPNALGGVLNPQTIPTLQTGLICGAANNQLLDEARDAALLEKRGIVYVPDFLANRMGIVNCADEASGTLPNDPTILRHLGRKWDNAVYVVTRRVLARAREEAVGTVAAAEALADELARRPHPIWPGRGVAIAQSLLAELSA